MGEPETTQALARNTVKSLGEFLQKYEAQIMSLAPRHLDREKMLRIAQVAVTRNPKLLECSPLSILDCVIKAGQVGLELNGPLRQADMIPYYNSKTKKLEAQFQIRYGGLIDLAMRSDKISFVEANPVYEGDAFDFQYGSEAFLHHKPILKGDRGELLAAYCIIRFKDGALKFKVMNREDIEKRRAVSKAAQSSSGPWVEWEAEMWQKTPTKAIISYTPISAEVSRAVHYDNQSEAGEVQDLALDFDFDSAKARIATEQKTEELKDKIATKRTSKGQPEAPVESPQRPTQPPAAPIQEPLPPLEAYKDEMPAQREKNNDRVITKDELDGWLVRCKAKSIPREELIAQRDKLGHETIAKVKLSELPVLMKWADEWEPSD